MAGKDRKDRKKSEKKGRKKKTTPNTPRTVYSRPHSECLLCETDQHCPHFPDGETEAWGSGGHLFKVAQPVKASLGFVSRESGSRASASKEKRERE